MTSDPAQPPPHAAPGAPGGPPPFGWAQPAPAGPPMATVPLRPTGVTVMLVLEAIAAALSILLIVSVVAIASSQGSPPPLAFAIAFCVVAAMMVLRCAALVLVRMGLAWPRWAYVGVTVVGTIGALVPGPLPLAFLLAILAIVTIVVLFGRTTRLWLRWRAERPTID